MADSGRLTLTNRKADGRTDRHSPDLGVRPGLLGVGGSYSGQDAPPPLRQVLVPALAPLLPLRDQLPPALRALVIQLVLEVLRTLPDTRRGVNSAAVICDL